MAFFLDVQQGKMKRLKTTTDNNNDTHKVTKDPTSEYSYWLMKSEPESRYEKGVDMKVCSPMLFFTVNIDALTLVTVSSLLRI